MATYTMQMRDIVKTHPVQLNKVLTEYPIFTEGYREFLNKKIINYFKFKEIGFETPEMFFDRLASWFDVEMEQYNFLYNSNLIKIEPLLRIQIHEEYQTDRNNETVLKALEEMVSNNNFTGDVKTKTLNLNKLIAKEIGKSTGKASSINDGSDKESDFPQSVIGSPDSSDHWSKANFNHDVGSQTTENNVTNDSNNDTTFTGDESQNNVNETIYKHNRDNNNNTLFDEIIRHVFDRTGLADRTDSSMLIEYRTTFINIDKMLLEHMQTDLFMLIYNNM